MLEEYKKTKPKYCAKTSLLLHLHLINVRLYQDDLSKWFEFIQLSRRWTLVVLQFRENR